MCGATCPPLSRQQALGRNSDPQNSSSAMSAGTSRKLRDISVISAYETNADLKSSDRSGDVRFPQARTTSSNSCSSSFSGELTRFDIGHIDIDALGNGTSTSCGSGSRLSQRFVVSRSEDCWHPVMDARHHFICRGCQDTERPHPFTSSRVAPVFPQPGDPERRAVLHGNDIGLLAALARLPLVKAVNRKNAAAGSVSVAECR